MQILTSMTWRNLNAPDDVVDEYKVSLVYSPSDPCVVTATIAARNTAVWELSRDLLAAGMLAPTGTGDVRVWPWPLFGEVEIMLTSPSGRADFACSLRELDVFLTATYALVPADAEYADTDVDAALLRWLEEAA